MNILNKVFGSSNSRKIKKMNRVVKRINEFEELLESLSDEELKYKTDELKGRLQEGETLDQLLPEAFAVVKETAKRFKEHSTLSVKSTDSDMHFSKLKQYVSIEGTNSIWSNRWDAAGKEVTWDMVHYDVQLIGGIALHRGKIAEMQTGEGKTLVATLPVYLNALTGNGVHLVTVNDYLAKRDSAWMAPLFQFHGLSVDCIDSVSYTHLTLPTKRIV